MSETPTIFSHGVPAIGGYFFPGRKELIDLQL